MKFAVVGDGALGRFIGAHLVEDGNDVVFFTRPDKNSPAASISFVMAGANHRLNVQNAQCLQQPGKAGLCDIVFLCVRRQQTESAIQSLRPVLSHDTAFVSLQQGFESYMPLVEKFTPRFVVGGTCSYAVEKDATGDVLQLGTKGKIVVGELDGQAGWRLEIIEAALHSAGLVCSQTQNIKQEILLRSVFESALSLCSVNGLSACNNVETFRQLVGESVDVLNDCGNQIDAGFVEDAVTRLVQIRENYKPLVVRDVDKNRTHENNWLSGWIAAKAKEISLEVPLHNKFLEVFQTWPGERKT